MKFLSPVITIDGPSGSGKSSLSLALSKKIKWPILQSGVIYRLLTLQILKNKTPLTEDNICEIIKKTSFLNSIKLLKKKIKKNKYNKNFPGIFFKKLSIISNFPKVRKLLLIIQRMFKKPPGLIAEGRDMGTLVFSNAILKFFLDANIESRAYRRKLQLQKNGFNVNFKDVLSSMWERDYKDYNRIVSPLMPAKNSIILDSTYLDFKQTFNIIIKYIKKNSILYSII